MQEHLHVGRMTWKRQARSCLIIASVPAFFFLFGFPFMRGDTTTVNGQQVVQYICVWAKRNYVPTRYKPPQFILVPLWNPHHNAAGMQWVFDGNGP